MNFAVCRKFKPLAFLFLILFSGTNTVMAQDSAPENIVRQLVAAFNAHDVDAMAALSDPKITWLSVSGEEVAVETEGVEATKTEMAAYFAATPIVHSEIEKLISNGPFVTTLERLSWSNENGEQHSQVSIAVFEVENNKIRRTWYFPAQP